MLERKFIPKVRSDEFSDSLQQAGTVDPKIYGHCAYLELDVSNRLLRGDSELVYLRVGGIRNQKWQQ